MNEVNTVIFDIGNVLMNFEMDKYLEDLYGPEMKERLKADMFGEGRWDELDRGALSDAEVLENIIKADPEVEDKLRFVFETADECMSGRDYAIPLVKSIKASGKQVYFLSNYSRYLIDKKPEVLNFIEYMDGGVFSCDVKLIKPDRKIYEALIEKYQLDPKTCVFIDDREENVEAAKELGIQTIWFNGYNNKLLDLLSSPMYY